MNCNANHQCASYANSVVQDNEDILAISNAELLDDDDKKKALKRQELNHKVI